MKNKKYLYLIRCGNSDFYKIGTSENPEERLQMLQIGCPFPLVLVYRKRFKEATKIEGFLHRKYRDKQKVGEWFELSGDEIYLIQQGQVMKDLLPKHIPMLNKIRAIDSLPPIEI